MLIDAMQSVTVHVATPTIGPAVRRATGQATWLRAHDVVRVTSGSYCGLGEAAPLQDAATGAATAVVTLQAALPFELEGPSRAYLLANGVADSAASRFALETALLDCWCQAHQVALANVLVTTPVADLATAAVVASVTEAVASVAAGFTTLKLKLSRDADADLVKATAIREAVGDTIRLRGDANQTWELHETPRRLRALAHLGWEFIEEPCPDTAKLLHMDLPIALALDESLPMISPAQFNDVLRARNLWGFVLKPTLLGGLLPTFGLANTAARAGKHAVVTHALEGPVGTAACAEAARAVAALFDQPVAAGLGNNPTLTPHGAAWTAHVQQLATPGHVRTAAGFGHGVTAPAWPQLLA